jgi:methyl-accepting chemotaxis protein
MVQGIRNISRQIGLITRANREHSGAAASVLGSLTEIRQITDRNLQGSKETARSAGDLLERAVSLNELMDGLQKNGRAAKKSKNKKKK